MARITNRQITDKFILYFEGDKPFTPSDKRMMGVKLSQLRKNVDQFVQENDIQTDLSTNEIIMDIIEYSKMMNMNFRSIASLGYNVLGESIEYWDKRRKIIAQRQSEKLSNQNEQKEVAKVITTDYNKINNKSKSPKWMRNHKW